VGDAFKTALIRAAIGGVALAGAAFFGVLSGDLTAGQQLGGHQLEVAGVAAGVVFFGNLVVRAGAEGLIDQKQAGNGGRRASDPPKAA
jgi:hypothetical protein